MNGASRLIIATLGLLVVSGCALRQGDVIMTGANPVELRSFQSRTFPTGDRALVLRGVISTLQDLAFVVDGADEQLGIVSGTRLSGTAIRITVLVRSLGPTQIAVRANAYHDRRAIERPEPYRDFYSALEKSLFLAGNAVN